MSDKQPADNTPRSDNSQTPGALRKAAGGAPASTSSNSLNFVPSLTPAVPSSSAAPKPKAKAALKFTPNVNKPGITPIPKASVSKISGSDAESKQNVSLQTMLAHRLAVQGNDTSSQPIARRSTGVGNTRIINTAVSNKLAAYNASRKKKDSKKSRDILELSWAPEDLKHDITLYTPISLPYVMRGDEDGDKVVAGNKSQRPTLKKVDEDNRNAVPLFHEDEEEDTLNWVLVQFPSFLPAINREAMEQQAAEIENKLKDPEELTPVNHQKPDITEAIDYKYMPTKLSGLPEGYLGEICIHKSGKVVLHIGEHEFDVNTGSDCNFSQEVGCYVPENSEFFFMGNCFKRMVVTPAVSQLSTRNNR